MGLYLLCGMVIIVHMEYMTDKSQSLALLISFYSGYEGAAKGISVYE